MQDTTGVGDAMNNAILTHSRIVKLAEQLGVTVDALTEALSDLDLRIAMIETKERKPLDLSAAWDVQAR